MKWFSARVHFFECARTPHNVSSKGNAFFCLGFGIGALHVSPPHGFASLEVERF